MIVEIFFLGLQLQFFFLDMCLNIFNNIVIYCSVGKTMIGDAYVEGIQVVLKLLYGAPL